MGLDKLYQLINSGRIDEIAREVETLEGEEHIEGQYWNIFWSFYKTRDFERAKREAGELIGQEPVSLVSQVFQLLMEAFILPFENKSDAALSKLAAAGEIITALPGETVKKQLLEAWSLYWRGYCKCGMGLDDEALELYARALDIALAGHFPLKYMAPDIHLWTGVSCGRKGEFQLAQDHYVKSQHGFRELGNEFMEAFALLGIGFCHHLQGDLDTALEKYLGSLELSQRTGNKAREMSGLFEIGHVYYSKGEFQQAVNCYQQSLILSKKDKTEQGLISQVDSLYGLIAVYLDLQDKGQVNQHLVELEELSKSETGNKFGYPYVEVHYSLAKARVLKTQEQFKAKAQASDLLRNLLEYDKLAKRERYLVLLELCDLLAQEAKVMGDEAVYQEMKAIFGDLKTLVRGWNTAPYTIDILILEAKLALVEGDMEQAFTILERARELAEKKGLGYLTGKVQDQQEQVRKALDQWQQLLDRNAPLQERLMMAELELYIRTAIKKFEL
ncbi:MAG: tetratricopeptide repeat protein [Candidatus Hermodarchaeota archaeon]